jgi:DHA2 family multidrug resistance protein-like MFS transporter
LFPAVSAFSHSMNVVALVGSLMLAVTAVTVTLVLRGTSRRRPKRWPQTS